MSTATVEFLSAVLLVSKDPGRLAQFYREVIGIPLEDEQHGDTEPHFGCTMGDIHFAIHPVSDFPDEGDGVGSVKLAFTVFDMNGFIEKLRGLGIDPLYPPRDEGFFIITALLDPDGNYLQFTQFSDDWFTHLEERKAGGMDVVARWRQTKATKSSGDAQGE